MKEKEELQNMLNLTHDKMEEYKSKLSSSVDQNIKGFYREEKENEGIYKELADRMEELSGRLSE